MAMGVLVTGGAGCIGSDVAEALIARGHEVVVLDNLSSGRIEHIAPLLEKPGFRFIQGDLLDTAALNSAMEGVQFVYHLAANPDVKFTPGDPTDKDLKQNTLATYNVLEAMRAQGVKSLVFSSTSAVYGPQEKLPIPEDAPPRPISLYGATKLSCEAMIRAYQHLFGLRCWIFRFANIVGPKIRKKGRTVISDFLYKLRQNPQRLEILGDGRQAKSYLLCSECVEGMLHAVEHASGAMSVFNLGGEDWLPVRRIADMVVAALGLPDVAYSYTGTEGGWPGDVPRFRLDVSAMGRLGWKARCTSEQAVALAIQQLLKHETHPAGFGNQAPCRQ